MRGWGWLCAAAWLWGCGDGGGGDAETDAARPDAAPCGAGAGPHADGGCDPQPPEERDAGRPDAARPDAATADAATADAATPDAATPDAATPDAAPPDTGFAPGPYGTGWRDLAGDVRLRTLDGDFDLARLWTGEDAFLFSFFTNDPRQPQDLRNYLETLWFANGEAAREVAALLDASPPDVHYVFGSFDEDAPLDVRRLKSVFDRVLIGRTEAERARWTGRLHFVARPLGGAEGWLRDLIAARSPLWFGIDSTQRLRQVGLLTDIVAGVPRLQGLALEARYFHFERERQATLDAAEGVTIVPVFHENVGHAVAEVELPPADVMAGFDTMEFDVGAYCPGHMDENCGEWDYLSNLYVCEQPVDAENPHAATPCRAAVPGAEGEPETPAETRACACRTPYGGVAERQQVCRADGGGFEACNCPCDAEIGRWITTYHREGRWVTDVSPLLALVKDGGRQRLRFASGNAYDYAFDIRLSNRGKGTRPDEIRFLWGGGAFNAQYNEGRSPITFTVPPDVRKVELVAYLTGHGFGVEADNCAEFCDHTHHFDVNGREFVKAHPVAGTATGCQEQVDEGVVPNQFGTWPFGRGGWCPGLDVKPWVADVTEALRPGENVITYRGLFEGTDYVPRPSGRGDGFGARVDVSSYLVFHR